MFTVCIIITTLCVYVVEQTFHNTTITVGLACLMGITSGIFTAMDERRNSE